MNNIYLESWIFIYLYLLYFVSHWFAEQSIKTQILIQYVKVELYLEYVLPPSSALF